MRQIVITDSKVIGCAKHGKDIRAILAPLYFLHRLIYSFGKFEKVTPRTMCLIRNKNYRKQLEILSKKSSKN